MVKDENLLVGFETSDDAAVYRLTPDIDDSQIVLAMDLLRQIAASDPDTQ